MVDSTEARTGGPGIDPHDKKSWCEVVLLVQCAAGALATVAAVRTWRRLRERNNR